MNDPVQIQNAKQTIQRLLPLIDQAEYRLKKARNWGVLDILGGGTLVDLFKHGNLHHASDIMNQVSYQLGVLQSQLASIEFSSDYKMYLGGFSSFADFLFDGAIADLYMQSKIMKSLEEVKNLKYKLQQLYDALNH